MRVLQAAIEPFRLRLRNLGQSREDTSRVLRCQIGQVSWEPPDPAPKLHHLYRARRGESVFGKGVGRLAQTVSQRAGYGWDQLQTVPRLNPSQVLDCRKCGSMLGCGGRDIETRPNWADQGELGDRRALRPHLAQHYLPTRLCRFVAPTMHRLQQLENACA